MRWINLVALAGRAADAGQDLADQSGVGGSVEARDLVRLADS